MENIVYHFHTTSYLNEEVDCSEPLPSASSLVCASSNWGYQFGDEFCATDVYF